MGLRLGVEKNTARLSTMTRCRERSHGATAGAAQVCGLRIAAQIRSNCWICGLTANGFFLFRGRDVAVTMNSVKILVS